MKKIKDYTINFMNGFCMAFADSVPGVSGGTVAFILGFYDKFIISLDDLFRGDKDKRKNSLIYLLKFGAGWVFGLLLAISFLSSLFNNYIYEMSSLFIGFIVMALPIVIKEEKKVLKGKYINIVYFCLGALLVGCITYLNRSNNSNFDLDLFNISTIIYVFFAGSLAISAMILPGISGSTILLIFGLYIPIVTRIKELLQFNFKVLPILIVFGLGVIFGIIVFTNFLRKCLEKRRSQTVYAILGMMVASIYSIIMGPTTLKNPLNAMSLSDFNILFFLLGCVIILSLEGIKKMFSNEG